MLHGRATLMCPLQTPRPGRESLLFLRPRPSPPRACAIFPGSHLSSPPSCRVTLYVTQPSPYCQFMPRPPCLCHPPKPRERANQGSRSLPHTNHQLNPPGNIATSERTEEQIEDNSVTSAPECTPTTVIPTRGRERHPPQERQPPAALDVSRQKNRERAAGGT